MNEATGAEQILSADLVPFIEQKEANALVVQLMSVRLEKQHQGNVDVEVGLATFKILETLYSNTLASGMDIDVPVNRLADPMIRAKNGFNQWNNLSLQPGSLMLLLCRSGANPKQCQGLGATRLESVSSSKVSALRRCYTIEYFKGSLEQRIGTVDPYVKTVYCLI